MACSDLCGLMARYDSWQQGAIIGANDTITNVNKSVREFWVNYGHEMVSNISALPSQHGAFVSNCPAHCQTGASEPHMITPHPHPQSPKPTIGDVFCTQHLQNTSRIQNERGLTLFCL